MAGVKETPRQKMMGILYLVLLGLAATTISDEVLDAFRNLSVGLENSTQNVQTTISQTFDKFAASSLKDDPTRAKPYWERANRVKAAATALDSTIAAIKAEFVAQCGGFDSSEGDYNQRENIDIVPRVMILNGKADELKKKIEDTKAKIIAELAPGERAGFKMSLNAEDPPRKEGISKTWQQNFFGDNIPLTAAFTALSKIESDLKNSEAEAVKRILSGVSKTDLTLDQYAAIAVPTTSSYVLIGQPYSAEVFLTAFSNTLNPEISVGGQVLNVAEGKGTYTVNANHEGEVKWSATIRMKKADGSMGEWKTPEMSYRVAKPSATVSPDKMLVFYLGVDNPITISAPGTPKEKLKVSINNGNLSGSNGNYVIQPKTSGKAIVTVMGQDDKGKVTKLGETEFRVKRLPTPRAKFGGKTGGTVPKAQLTSTDKVFASLDDFDFAAAFTVNHYKLYVVKPRQDPQIFEASSNMLNAQSKAAMSGVVAGTRVIFDDIFATGPDGLKRPLDPIIFTVQ